MSRHNGLVFIILLTSFITSFSVQAAWLKYDGGNGATYYADPERQKNKGGNAFVYDMSDYQANKTLPSGEKFRSKIAEIEFDCAESRYRFLATKWFSENMGRGNIVYSWEANLLRTGSARWHGLGKNDSLYVYWAAACEKKGAF
jgi:hypothetical protein